MDVSRVHDDRQCREEEVGQRGKPGPMHARGKKTGTTSRVAARRRQSSSRFTGRNKREPGARLITKSIGRSANHGATEPRPRGLSPIVFLFYLSLFSRSDSHETSSRGRAPLRNRVGDQGTVRRIRLEACRTVARAIFNAQVPKTEGKALFEDGDRLVAIRSSSPKTARVVSSIPSTCWRMIRCGLFF